MIINFIGNFQSGYVGEVADETHIARELESLGHTVRRIPRDEWKEHVDTGATFPNVPTDLEADFSIICKWHHFEHGGYIHHCRAYSGGSPVFYWVWDHMYDNGMPMWHLEMIEASDLYLGNDVRSEHYPNYLKPKLYYFNFDVCDGDIPTFDNQEKIYDVVFTGSCIDQGNRKEFIQKINEKIPVKVFAWNPEEWQKLGIDASPAVYGAEYNKVIAQSNIVLGISVEPNCWGYWSNRVGKVLRAGGFLLQEYAPGMETFLLPHSAIWFSTPEEAVELIEMLKGSEHFKNRPVEHPVQFTSAFKVVQLIELAERYILKKGNKWNL